MARIGSNILLPVLTPAISRELEAIYYSLCSLPQFLNKYSLFGTLATSHPAKL